VVNFGDQGHHRTAFMNDVVVIDSSAREAICPKRANRKPTLVDGRDWPPRSKAVLQSKHSNSYLCQQSPDYRAGGAPGRGKEFKKLARSPEKKGLIQFVEANDGKCICLYRCVSPESK